MKFSLGTFLLRLVLVTFVSGTATSVYATQDFQNCPQFFPQGVAPTFEIDQKWLVRQICYESFAVLYSGATRTPLYVVERINRTQLQDAQGEKRSYKFFADARIPYAERASLEDYKGSGFDRGHMAPAADMSNSNSMEQSFSLANVVPQAPKNNQKSWASIEKATRKYVMRAKGDVFVFTGPAFLTRPILSIGAGKIWVPSHLFKLVYDPSTGRAWAHWLENSDEARVTQPIPYEELVKKTGIKFLVNLQKLSSLGYRSIARTSFP